MYLATGYKIFLTLKEVQIKMSSLLNDSSKPQEFSLKDIEVFVDSKEQNWFKQAHVEKFLGKEDIWASLNGLEKCEMFTRQGVVPRPRVTPGWSGSKDEQNKIFQYIYQKHSS